MSIRYSNLFVSVSTFILTLLVVMPFSVYAQQNENNKDIVATQKIQSYAKQDARDNESTFKWMLGGCCLIGTGMAYVAKPTPPKTALSDKSAEYVEIYEQAYESEAKKKRRLEDGRRDARHIRTTRLCRRARRAQSTAARRA